MLDSGDMKVSLAVQDRLGEATHVKRLWFTGPDREKGGIARVAVPIDQNVRDGTLTVTLSAKAVGNAPTDLLQARPSGLDAELSPRAENVIWDRTTRALGPGVSRTARRELRLARAGALAATGGDKPIREGETEADGATMRWRQYADGHVGLSFEGADAADEGRTLCFPVNAKTQDGDFIRRAFAVLVLSPLSDKPSAVFEFDSAAVLDLDAEEPVTATESRYAVSDLAAIEWSIQHACGQQLKTALEDLLQWVEMQLPDEPTED